MKEITLYREDNGQYSTSEAKQDDVSGVYIQKDYLTDLQAQNDELRANNERLKTALNLTLVSACNDYSCTEDFHDSMHEVLHETPAQSLADIRAEAVIDAAKNIRSEVMANECYYTVFAGKPLIPISIIEEYANKLKGGE